MNKLLEIFSTRELSLFSWIVIFIIILMFVKSIRTTIWDLVKMLFQKSFLKIYFILSAYLFLLFYFLNSINIWDFSYLKDSILWLFTVGFVLIFKSVQIKDTTYFKSILKESLKWTVIFEFIINFYSFNFIIEFLMLPILIMIVTTQAYSELDKKNIQVTKLLTNVLSIIGFVFLGFSIYKTIIGYETFFSINTLKIFVLPIILTILFIPFIYFLSLYSTYESYFVRLDFMTVKKDEVKVVKKLIKKRANLHLNRLNRIIENFDKRVFYDNTNLKEYIEEISKMQKQPVANIGYKQCGEKC